MSEIPLSMDKLEAIVEVVARELLESWAIEDRFNEDQIKEAHKNAIDDTVLVINKFMENFNEYMFIESEQSTQKKLIVE